MPVITVTITESPIQIVSGIPKTVSIETNISSTVFYTLDGTEPTVSSEIYVEPIKLPTDKASVTLSIFATNGVDSSAVITNTYGSATAHLARRPHDKVLNLNVQPLPGKDLGPFGTNSPHLNIVYGNTGGIIVDSPNISNIPDGYDGTGTGTFVNGTDQELSNYKFKYSESNAIGETGENIGTLPAKVKLHVPMAPPVQSNANSKLFNPKSLVIIQDGRNPPEDPDVSLVNRPYFFSENAEKTRGGTLYSNTALEGSIPTGSLLRQHYNPREQTITYYYWDSASLKWIISIEPFKPKSADVFSLSNVVFPSSSTGSAKVFKWIPFKRSSLI